MVKLAKVWKYVDVCVWENPSVLTVNMQSLWRMATEYREGWESERDESLIKRQFREKNIVNNHYRTNFLLFKLFALSALVFMILFSVPEVKMG